MNLSIAVVDDIRLDREKLQQGIYKYFSDKDSISRTVACFAGGESLLKVYEPEKFQIVFMDILMNDLSGIQTAQKLRAADNKTLLVFTTTSSDYAFDAFPLHPFDYIIKPCTQDKLGRVLNEAVNFLETPEPAIDIHVSRSTYKVRIRDISAVMSRDHFVEVVLADGRCILCSMKFRDIEETLSKYPCFLLCNREIIINMDCAASLSRNREVFIMKDGTNIPIRIRGRTKVIDDFTQYQISRIRGGVKL